MTIITHTDTDLAFPGEMNTAISIMLYSLSDSSKRQYRHTFRLWIDFALANGFHPLALSADHVIAFLEQDELAKATKQARLTHLRKLAEALHTGDIANPEFEQNYKQIRLLKLKSGNGSKPAKDHKALSPDEIFRAFDKWGNRSLLAKRNQALLAILFYAGLRRSELVNLTWDDIDLANGLITVQHGKGDKSRTIPFASDRALTYVRNWYEALHNTVDQERSFMFPNIRRGDNLQDDRPITTHAIWKITKELGFSPHDARRTLITRGLAAGSSVADMQFIAGHVNPQTTLGYAQVKDAKEVKGRVKIDY